MSTFIIHLILASLTPFDTGAPPPVETNLTPTVIFPTCPDQNPREVC